MGQRIGLATTAVLFVAVLATAASMSHAALVTWTLHDVVFEDGGTATGSFVVNTAINEKLVFFQVTPIISFDLTTTAGTHPVRGSQFSGAEYKSALGALGYYANSLLSNRQDLALAVVGIPDIAGHTFECFVRFPCASNLELAFLSPLIATTGTVFLEGTASDSSASGEEVSVGAYPVNRLIVSGSASAVAVPEPNGLAVIALGLLLLFRKRGTKVSGGLGQGVHMPSTSVAVLAIPFGVLDAR